jgi:hypothetical protein
MTLPLDVRNFAFTTLASVSRHARTGWREAGKIISADRLADLLER